jgi:hypothetical protein
MISFPFSRKELSTRRKKDFIQTPFHRPLLIGEKTGGKLSLLLLLSYTENRSLWRIRPSLPAEILNKSSIRRHRFFGGTSHFSGTLFSAGATACRKELANYEQLF